MKLTKVCVLFFLIALTGISVRPASAIPIDLNSLTNDYTNGVDLELDAGEYIITPMGIEDGGEFNAWNKWGILEGCDEDGFFCTKGWVSAYSFETSSGITLSYNMLKYATDLLALADASIVSFTLDQAETVRFFIYDTFYTDNVGGISLDITLVGVPDVAVPEPSTLFLLGSGLIGLFVFNRRKKQPLD